jgi:hypothetical protein
LICSQRGDRAFEDNLHVRPFCGSRLFLGMFLAFLFGAIGAIVAEVLKRGQQWNDMPCAVKG